MSQSKVKKDRTCSHCNKLYHATAKEIKSHANLCGRAKAVGLVLAGGVTLK